MLRRGITVVLVAVTIVVAGCSFADPEENRLLGRWRVVSFSDENGRPEPVEVGETPHANHSSPSNEAAMRAEERITGILGGGPRTVEFDGEDRTTLTVRSAGGEMVLERVGGDADDDGAIAPYPPIGPLECGDGLNVEVQNTDSGLGDYLVHTCSND